MITAGPVAHRDLKVEKIECDLCVVGGGLSGVCAAIAAARAGIRVTLVQDRPVLGGNASSEVRLWVLGATSHMGNNNRWSREGGVIDEILLENIYRNPEGNALVFDTVIMEKVVEEPNIRLLLNTAVHDLSKKDADTIESVRAFCSQNSTTYDIHAPLFCDASGDGVVGFMAGAAFRMGAESAEEFGEKFAPSPEYGQLLGHSLYFYSKDTGKPVRFTPPSYALKDITQIPRWRNFNSREHGCKLWWVEYGGRRDTVHDTEEIKWELWKVIYGVWNHIKNSGQFPEAETMTLEWVGTVPGKRESRRFEGDYMLIQQDIVEQRAHADVVSFGGWAMDLHPADGVYSEKSGCNQWHSKGIYGIPYRCLYSRNIKNLFLAGRVISASHVAFGSTRVMATCGYTAQAVGVAAALCKKLNVLPRALSQGERLRRLQLELTRVGQYLPGIDGRDEADLSAAAKVTASSRLRLAELAPSSQSVALKQSRAMIVPVKAGRMPSVSFWVEAEKTADLAVELRAAKREGNFTPDVTLASRKIRVEGAGQRKKVTVDFGVTLEKAQYVFVCFLAAPTVSVALSDTRVTGVLSVRHKGDDRVAESATQTPPAGIGIDTFEFWIPERRPAGQNIAMQFEPALDVFAAENVAGGPERPTTQPNAWVANQDDREPWVELVWDKTQEISELTICFDNDFDHAVESVLMGHPERIMPFCVRKYRVRDEQGKIIGQAEENHQARNTLRFDPPLKTKKVRIELEHPLANVPAGLMRVWCKAKA